MYFRDPGFDQTTTGDLGKRKISWREMGFDWSKRGGGRGEGERDPIPLPFFPSSLSPIPYPYPFRRLLRRLRSDSGDDPKENEQKKKALGTGREGEESPLSPSSFPLHFSLRSMPSARSNAAIHKENFFIPFRNTTHS